MAQLIMHRNLMTLWNFWDGAAIYLGFWVFSCSGEVKAVGLQIMLIFFYNK